MSLIKRAVASAAEARLFGAAGFGIQFEDENIPRPSEVDAVDGRPVSEDLALQLIAVYACVSLIADASAMLPLHAYRNLAGGGREKVRPQPALVDNPDYESGTRYDWTQRVITSLLLRGNFYGLVTAWRGDRPLQVRPIHPDMVRRVTRDQGDRLAYEMHEGPVRYRFTEGGDLIHIPGFVRPGEFQGVSPISAGAAGIAGAKATDEFGRRWFSDGAHPSGVLETPEEDLGDEAAKKLRSSWLKAHNNRRYPAVLTGGIQWKPIQISPDESQFLETRRFNINEIARLYRVPPHLISDVDRSTSWGTGIEEQGLGFVTYTLQPWLTRIELALSELLPPPQYVKFNPGALLRGRTKDRYAAYAIARNWGWLSVNDIRELEDLPPIDEGDVYLQPLNMVDTETAPDIYGDQPGGSSDEA